MMRRYLVDAMQGAVPLALALFVVSGLCLFQCPVQAVTRIQISGSHPAAESSMSAGGSYVVYIEDASQTSAARKVYYYNGTTSTQITYSGTQKANWTPSISANGTFVVFVINAGFPNGWPIYQSTNGGTASVLISGDCSSPAIDDSGNVVAYKKSVDASYRIEAKDAGGTTILGAADAASVPVVSANGRYVAYATGGSVHLFDRDIDAPNSGGTVIAAGSAPAINDAGSRVAYIGTDGKAHVYSSSGDMIISGGAINCSEPAISAIAGPTDGNFITYVTDGHVKVYHLTNGTTRDYGTGANPSVSADGNTVSLEDGGAVYLVTNTPPTATPQSVNTPEETAKVITLAGTDAEGDSQSYKVATYPEHGTLTGVNPDGTLTTAPNLTYTPNTNYNDPVNPDSFTFIVNDGTADSAPATVDITVTPVNDPPVASAGTLTVEKDTPATGTLVANDVDGDTLTYGIVTNGIHGTATMTDAETGTYSYTPEANYVGADSFTFKVNDGSVDSNIATISVTIDPHPAPVVTAITPGIHENTGRLTVTDLAGTGFRAGATVQLRKTGQPNITARNVVVVSGTRITCEFNFMSNATGVWDVAVTNDDEQTGTLTGGVTLTAAPPHIVSITPNSGVNTGTIDIVNLAGSGFNNPTVELRRAGETPIPMTDIILYGPTMITGAFDLTGKVIGAWDVVVTNGDTQSDTLTNGFTIGAEPAPAPTSVSPVTVVKPGTKTLTVNGADFAGDAVVTLTKSGETDRVLTMSSRTATKLVGSVDISNMPVGQWNVAVSNHPGGGDEQSAMLANALAVTEAALTGVTLTADKAWPQPTGSVITLTATKTGTATNVEYQFWARIFNQTTSQSEYLLLRDYQASNTYAWTPTTNNSYWLYVYAREDGSAEPYQVASTEVYFKVEVGTLTGVTLAVSPSSPKPTGTPITLTATKSGTAVDVEYRFVYKWYNSTTHKWDDGEIRGYQANDNTCTWAPGIAGQYRLYALARIVGSTALFDRISPYKAFTITP